MIRSIKRRRKENKTDYLARLTLLKSGKSRLVVRKTNRYIIAQIIDSNVAQDKVVVGVNSHDLLANGWPKELTGSLKGIPAAYLTGFMLAQKAKEKKVAEAILDLGLYRNVKKSRLYAVLKGAVEGGLKIPHDSAALPEMKKITNEKVAKAFEKAKEALK